MPNLCKFHPNYDTLVVEWKAKNAGGTDRGKKGATAEDIQLQKVLMGIQESDSEEEDDDEYGTRQTHEWVWPITIWCFSFDSEDHTRNDCLANDADCA
jgi:hypothetical protein